MGTFDGNMTGMTIHRVVVVGGGFAGLQAVRGLRDAPVEVTLVDRQNYTLFQPLVYQVATGALSPAEIAMPLRRIVRHQRNARVVLGEVCASTMATFVQTSLRHVQAVCWIWAVSLALAAPGCSGRRTTIHRSGSGLRTVTRVPGRSGVGSRASWPAAHPPSTSAAAKSDNHPPRDT